MSKKRKGYYCWFCQRQLPKKKHFQWQEQHFCKDCERIGRAEFDFLLQVGSLVRLASSNGLIGRNHRKAFNRFLNHSDGRIRAYAEFLDARDAHVRKRMQEASQSAASFGEFHHPDIGSHPVVSSWAADLDDGDYQEESNWEDDPEEGLSAKDKANRSLDRTEDEEIPF